MKMLAVNLKILCFGIVMMGAGFTIISYLAYVVPPDPPTVTEQEIAELMLDEQQNSHAMVLSSILVGLGFLFVLVSFGTAKGEGRTQTRKNTPAKPPN